MEGLLTTPSPLCSGVLAVVFSRSRVMSTLDFWFSRLGRWVKVLLLLLLFRFWSIRTHSESFSGSGSHLSRAERRGESCGEGEVARRAADGT